MLACCFVDMKTIREVKTYILLFRGRVGRVTASSVYPV
jgi:hypothetical protein